MMATIAAVWFLAMHLPVPPSDKSISWGAVSRAWTASMDAQALSDAKSVEQSLPDQWAAEHLPQRGAARYVLHFERRLNTHNEDLWALRFQDISQVHRVFINHHLVADTQVGSVAGGSAHSAVIRIPPSLLLTGGNTLTVDVWHERQGGLSTPTLATWSAMRPLHLMHDVLNRHALIALNLASLAFSLFVLILWW